MEKITRLSGLEVKAVLAEFGIFNLSGHTLLSGGSENTNYLITAESGKYVLCICEQKSLEKVTEMTQLLAHLGKNNFRTSKIIYTTQHEPVLYWKEKPTIVKPYIEGEIQQDLSPNLLESIGKELGKLHQIEAPNYLPTHPSYGIEHFGNVQQYAPDSSFRNWLQEIETLISPYFKLDLPKSIIHSDLFWDNVIISEKEDRVTLVDFEESVYYYRVFDIGMAIIGLCGEGERVNLEKARFLLAGYQKEVQLLPVEIDALKVFTLYAGASMTFWRHQNFNHIKPDPELFNHYLGLKVLVDFLADQNEDCFSNFF